MLIAWRVVDFLLVKLHGSGVKLHNYFFVIGKDFPKVGGFMIQVDSCVFCFEMSGSTTN